MYGSASIEITGGEPFLYPSFVELMKRLCARHTLRITTNLSVNEAFLEQFAAQVDAQSVSIEASFHPAFIGLDAFMARAIILKERGFPVRVQYVAYPAQLKLIVHYDEEFRKKGLSFSVTSFWGTYNGVSYPAGYNEEERVCLRNYLKDLQRIELNLEHVSPRGRLCQAGSRFALIRGDGKVVRCGQKQQDNYIGFFLDEGFRLLEAPAPCAAESCPCNDFREG